MAFHIQEVHWEKAYQVSLLIPEFEPWYSHEKWQDRLSNKSSISLIAFDGNEVAGFKVGYFETGYFYSWVGGVIPAYRRQGVAGMLAEAQEDLVRKVGISVITMKTRNRFTEMLLFAIGQGFQITGVEQKGERPDWRIILHKNL